MMTWELILRIFVAGILGGAIGLEREYRAKEAGFRTHFLVALGAALFMIISAFGFGDILGTPEVKLDPSRVAAQVVTGIGFIGAGTIIFQKHMVKGLTTAAGLWVTAAIGMAIGGGLYTLGIATTLMVLLALEAFTIGFEAIGVRTFTITLSSESETRIREALSTLSAKGVEISTYDMEHKHGRFEASVTLLVRRSQMNSVIPDLLAHFNDVMVEQIN